MNVRFKIEIEVPEETWAEEKDAALWVLDEIRRRIRYLDEEPDGPIVVSEEDCDGFGCGDLLVERG